jgi:PhzF family phenazine biosynthesis protein
MEVLRYTAFSTDPAGGNPAGVVLDAAGADESTMAAIAVEVGYSETAFLSARDDGDFDIRYFSPRMEVAFCGHATIATAVAYAERHGPGPLRLHTGAGAVAVTTGRNRQGDLSATLTSAPPRSAPLAEVDLRELLTTLRWSADDLDPALPPAVAYAGVWHPVIAAASRGRLAGLDYDRPALTALMDRHDWTTIDLVWRESADTFHARNPFPTGGVLEDPATGAAAAAFGGYLRERGLIEPPATFTVHVR